MRELFQLKGTAKSKWDVTQEDKVLEQTSKYTQSLIESSWDYGEEWFDCPEIRTTIMSGIFRIGQCFLKQSENAAIFDLQKASMIFLRIVEAIEMILWNMKPKTLEELLDDVVYVVYKLENFTLWG